MDRRVHQIGGGILFLAGMAAAAGGALHPLQAGILADFDVMDVQWRFSQFAMLLAGPLFVISTLFLTRHFAGADGEGLSLLGTASLLLAGVALIGVAGGNLAWLLAALGGARAIDGRWPAWLAWSGVTVRTVFVTIRGYKIVTNDSVDDQVARMAKALGHPARVAILRMLARRACVCGEIVDLLPLAQSTVSQHLRVLREAGWITGKIDGPCTCYSLDVAAINQFRLVLDPLLEQWEGAACCSMGASCS